MQSVTRVPVGVLDRSVAILDAVEQGARTLGDVVARTGLHRATAHRLAAALEDHGLLTREGGHGYRLGPRLLSLATAAARELPLRELAHPAIERLARATGETAQLYVRSGDRRVCVDAVESTSELRTIVPVGADLPLTAGSAGKIFLAWAANADRERLLLHLEPYTPATPTDPQVLRRQLAVARRRGWANSVGEREHGVASVSAPVVGPHGELVAVASVSGPATRIARGRAAQYAPAVLAAAQEIARALGAA